MAANLKRFFQCNIFDVLLNYFCLELHVKEENCECTNEAKEIWLCGNSGKSTKRAKINTQYSCRLYSTCL